MSEGPSYSLAVVGMAGKFAGAADLEALWQNLERGVETVSAFSVEELAAAGVPASTLADPRYVRAKGVLERAEWFDAGFFGISGRDAALIDPQQRLFLECCWEALESAGIVPGARAGAVGVFAGVTQSTYFLANLLARPELIADAGLEVRLGNDKDFLATFAAYKLDLRGPALTVSTACSTSLVAVHLACQALLNRECDAALAGGVTVAFPQRRGYFHQPGGIFSADGHCRSFDHRATGSLAGEGVGVVVLRRLEDALAAGDPIRAIVRASAVNNDGARKIGFTAPSADGQAAVITEAQALAGVDPASITYIEAHGSATPLGDPIEIEALTRAFRLGTDRRGFCAVGSVKSNLGHCDAAAGIAGFLKTVLALEKKRLPPSLHLESPNPAIAWEESPFRVAAKLSEWTSEGPRRAGVSAFGIGGTNAHVVLEEAPEPPAGEDAAGGELLLLSAATPSALEEATDRLARHLRAHPEQRLSDVAHTLRTGRRVFRQRRALVAADRDDALRALSARDGARLLSASDVLPGRRVVFLLPGVGDHYAEMGRGLYESEPVYRQAFDEAAALFSAKAGLDLRALLYGAEARRRARAGARPEAAAFFGRRKAGEEAPAWLAEPLSSHAAVFTVSLATARLWQSWRIEPAALLGYSLGEVTAAVLAGVLELADGVALVVERARWIATTPAGGQLAVALSAAEARALARDGIELAAVTAPQTCLLAGSGDALDALERDLSAAGVASRRLPSAHAVHTASIVGRVGELASRLESLAHAPARLALMSNLEGRWIEPGETLSAQHWLDHLTRPVRLAEGFAELARREPKAVWLEVGAGVGLTGLALQQGLGAALKAVPSLPPAYQPRPDLEQMLEALAKLWLAGVDLDGETLSAGRTVRKVPLPVYPFQRQRYIIEPLVDASVPVAEAPPSQPSREERRPAGHERPVLEVAYRAPRVGTEARLAAIWEALLGVRGIGADDGFLELGGTSLLAPRVLLAVREAFGVELSIPVLLGAPTVAALAERIEAVQTAGAAPRDGEDAVDLVAAARLEEPLPAPLRATGSTLVPPGERGVLLTGATGFLGAHLLAELLRAGEAPVRCLVRGRDETDARRRVREALVHHGLLDAMLERDLEARCAAVPGDLAAPRFGLGEETFAALAARTAEVYHAGAWVNFTYPYSALAPINVSGTEMALRLAALAEAPLCFVSSLAVFAAERIAGEEVGWEDSPLERTAGLEGGYPRSKWAAEGRVREARRAGVPVTIVRPGVIGGDSVRGGGNPRDLLWAFLKGCLQMGAAPDVPYPFDPVPVDFVSRAMVSLARRPETRGGSYHLFHPEAIPWSEVFRAAAARGFEVEILPVNSWLARLERIEREQPDNALLAFWPLLAPEIEAAREAGSGSIAGPVPPRRWRFDDRRARAALAEAGIACPPLAGHLLGLYLDTLVASGFLPAPRPVARSQR